MNSSPGQLNARQQMLMEAAAPTVIYRWLAVSWVPKRRFRDLAMVSRTPKSP